MKHVLITGGCGFIGSNFINHYFYKSECCLVNIDAMYYCANENNVAKEIRNSPRYTLIKGNIVSIDLVQHILNYFTIDTVIHFAAQSHVETSFSDALKYTHDNIVGTHTLLECCRLYGKILKFIHISTDEVYGESMLEEHENKKNENSILCPTNPYAATKAAAELIVKSYYHSFKMPIIITRGNNVYGPNQYPEKVIPLFIKLLKEQQPITIQGDGTNVRSFLHVKDVAKALELILVKGVIGEIYNIGGDDSCEYTIDTLAKKIIMMIHNTDNYDKWITYIKDRPFNDKRYYISNDKLKQLGWMIEENFEDGLKELCNQTV
jgi:dTDP-glucose 4,6-dehydratase